MNPFKTCLGIFPYITLYTLWITASLAASPDFMIIGVTKCGTSFLYANLLQHPQILGANKKEIHYFDEKYQKGHEWYLNQFPVKNNSQKKIGEASPGYFWKRNCLERIAQDCPETKFILILRNPVKRAISSYFYFNSTEPQRGNLDFFSTIYKKSHRDHLFTNYERHIGAGYYSYHLKRWLEYFPLEQIHVLFLEDLIENPQREFNKIFAFLSIAEREIDIVDKKNKTKYDQSTIPNGIIDWLKALYKPYNSELEQLLNCTLPWDI